MNISAFHPILEWPDSLSGEPLSAAHHPNYEALIGVFEWR